MTLLEMSALYAESAAALRRRIGELRQAARELKDEEDRRLQRRQLCDPPPQKAADHGADAAAAGDPGAGGADGPLLRQELSQT